MFLKWPLPYDNYRTNGALVNVALATGNVGRPGGGCVRLGGHQEGYSRPSDAFVGRPAPYVDQLLINGRGGAHHIWACDHYKTTLNALNFKQVYKRVSPGHRKDAPTPLQSEYPLREILVASLIQGAVFSGVKALIDRGGARVFQKWTGEWPGD